MAGMEPSGLGVPDGCEILEFVGVDSEAATSALHLEETNVDAMGSLISLKRQADDTVQGTWADMATTLYDTARDCSTCIADRKCMLGCLVLGIPPKP